MPTSDPGSNKSRCRSGKPLRRAAGFTLLEMLVVLVIAGILISVASLAVTRNPRTDLNEEARRMALLFEAASDEAQVRSRPIAWEPVRGGYRFLQRSGNGWMPLHDDLLGPKFWQGGVTGAAIEVGGGDTSRIVFGVESIDVPVRVRLLAPVGQVSIFNSGNGRYQVR